MTPTRSEPPVTAFAELVFGVPGDSEEVGADARIIAELGSGERLRAGNKTRRKNGSSRCKNGDAKTAKDPPAAGGPLVQTLAGVR